MSPEQVRGRPADHRSDLFAHGTILYEMLSGRRAFQRDSAVETMSAILKEDPPDLAETRPGIPPALERVVAHCLEKSPEARFQSARDLAFGLEALSTASASGMARTALSAWKPKRWRGLALAALALAAALTIGYLAGERAAKPSAPSILPLTFRNGPVYSARFAPDGQTIVYGAAWDGHAVELFSTRTDSPESRPLGLGPSTILSISPSGEMAVLLRPTVSLPLFFGLLARVALGGGAPREIADEIQSADWGPDGNSLAVVRRVGTRSRLEYPIGTVLYETSGMIRSARVSPRGDKIAFIDDPVVGDTAGWIATVDRSRSMKKLSRRWDNISGLAWSPGGEEIWFTAAEVGLNLDIYATTPSGKERRVLQTMGRWGLRDISRDGRMLLLIVTKYSDMNRCQRTWKTGTSGAACRHNNV